MEDRVKASLVAKQARGEWGKERVAAERTERLRQKWETRRGRVKSASCLNGWVSGWTLGKGEEEGGRWWDQDWQVGGHRGILWPNKENSQGDPLPASIAKAHTCLTRPITSVPLAPSRVVSAHESPLLECMRTADCHPHSSPPSLPTIVPPGVSSTHLPRRWWVLGGGADWDRRLAFYQTETHPQNCTFRSLSCAGLCLWKDLLISRRSWHQDIRARWEGEEGAGKSLSALHPVTVWGCLCSGGWTTKKAEGQRTDAFKSWCWKRLWKALDCKEIQPVHPKGNPKGNQPWIFMGRTDAEAEASILWPPDVKSQILQITKKCHPLRED